MPVYEYKCAKCGVVEVMQSIKDAPLRRCPQCKSKVERMISSSSFVLKGSGWYATDYAKKTPPSAETSSAGGATNGSAAAGDAAKSGGDKSAPAAETKAASAGDKAGASAKSAPSPKAD